MSERHPTVSEFLSNPTPELEKNFFARMRLPNKTLKTTKANRLDDLNVFALPWIASKPSPSVMDVAVSSGISTVEWLQFLSNSGISCTMVATDYLSVAQYFPFTRHLGFLADDRRRLLHIDLLGYGFPHDLGIHKANIHYCRSSWALYHFSRSSIVQKNP
jgi:hypothetical protein